MVKRKTVRGNETLPFYIEKVDDLPVLDGYTWRELAQGYYGDYRPLPCPQCGKGDWGIDGLEACVYDNEPLPTLERALTGITRRGLIKLIKQLAIRGK